jgi:hypothetical protein
VSVRAFACALTNVCVCASLFEAHRTRGDGGKGAGQLDVGILDLVAFIQDQVVPGTVTLPCVVSVWCQWSVSVVSVECQCGVSGVSVWCQYGVSMVSVWCQCGVSMVSVWCQYGLSVVSVWCQYGVSVVSPTARRRFAQ